MLYLPSLALSPAEVYNAGNPALERAGYPVDVGVAVLGTGGYPGDAIYRVRLT